MKKQLVTLSGREAGVPGELRRSAFGECRHSDLNSHSNPGRSRGLSGVGVKRILVFGTFDILHKGHLNFFKQARALSKNPYLIVSVSRSQNAKNIKGYIPTNSQKQRMKKLKSIRHVDKVILGAIDDYLTHIYEQKPDIIALGYDQKAYTKNLKNLLEKKGVFPKFYRLKPYFPAKYKTSLLKSAIINNKS